MDVETGVLVVNMRRMSHTIHSFIELTSFLGETFSPIGEPYARTFNGIERKPTFSLVPAACLRIPMEAVVKPLAEGRGGNGHG